MINSIQDTAFISKRYFVTIFASEEHHQIHSDVSTHKFSSEAKLKPILQDPMTKQEYNSPLLKSHRTFIRHRALINIVLKATLSNHVRMFGRPEVIVSSCTRLQYSLDVT